MRITQSDYENWWNLPVGLEVKAMLNERREKIAHGLGTGEGLFVVQTHGELVGRYREITDLLNMTFQELMGEQ